MALRYIANAKIYTYISIGKVVMCGGHCLGIRKMNEPL